MQSETFNRGQMVFYPTAPDGIAQIDEVLRTNVEVIWMSKGSGRIRRKRISKSDLALLQRDQGPSPLLPLFNPLGRAIREANHGAA